MFDFWKRVLKSVYPPSSVCNTLNGMRKFIMLTKKKKSNMNGTEKAIWVMNEILIRKIKLNAMHNEQNEDCISVFTSQ